MVENNTAEAEFAQKVGMDLISFAKREFRALIRIYSCVNLLRLEFHMCVMSYVKMFNTPYLPDFTHKKLKCTVLPIFCLLHTLKRVQTTE